MCVCGERGALCVHPLTHATCRAQGHRPLVPGGVIPHCVSDGHPSSVGVGGAAHCGDARGHSDPEADLEATSPKEPCACVHRTSAGACRLINTHTHKHTYTHTHTYISIQTDRQTDRQTDTDTHTGATSSSFLVRQSDWPARRVTRSPERTKPSAQHLL